MRVRGTAALQTRNPITMAQRGSGRSGSGSKARPTGRAASSGRGSAGGNRGKSGGNRQSRQQTAAAAQKAIRGARGGGGFLRVGLPILVVVIVAAAVVVGVVLTSRHNSANGGTLPPTADTSTQLLANTAKQATGDPVDGVQSNSNEQVIFHVHAHLAMYVNGQQKLLPYGVGIVPPYQLTQQTDGSSFVSGGTKYYWLHTHDESGVIHIESPVQRTYTLGNFFDEWGQPLGLGQIGPYKGKITAWVNGKSYTGNPRDIQLTAHNVIQLDLGTPAPPFSNYTFPNGE